MSTPLQTELARILADPDCRLRDGKKLSRAAWSTAAGQGKTYVRDLLDSPRPNPSAEGLAGLAVAVGLPKAHFMTFTDKGGGDAVPSVQSRPRDLSREGSVLDPSINRIQSADLFRDVEFLSTNPDGDWGDYMVAGETMEPRKRRLLRVETDRMAPRYRAGETIAVENAAPKEGDHVWVEFKPTGGIARTRPAMLRLLKEQDSTTLTLIQYYPKPATTTVDRKRVLAVYRVLSGDDLLNLLGARL